MINVSNFSKFLENSGIDFFVGVPDSLLKDFCSYVMDNFDNEHHIIAANEGNAVGIAMGHYLASNKPALVYMQNSGQGNSINPLASLAHSDCYKIPLLLLIGWRGEPGVSDEPQHKKQGKITLELLDILDIPYSIIGAEVNDPTIILEKALAHLKKNNGPYAIVVKKDTFGKYSSKLKSEKKYEMTREEALKSVISSFTGKEAIISTTGMLSRELFEIRKSNGQGHEKDFLTIGGMGHASSIALGIAAEDKSREIYCLDGDGSIIMHMGSLAINALVNLKNFKHIVFNNSSHDSVGGQPTAAKNINLSEVAKACGYKNVFVVKSIKELSNSMEKFRQSEGPSFLEIRVKKGNRKDLGRPTTTPIKNKEDFMEFLKK